MTDDDAKWIPVKVAVAELAEVYHADMRDTFVVARTAAINAIWYNLRCRIAKARASYWSVLYRRPRGNISGLDSRKHGPQVPAGIWHYCLKSHESHMDWVAGDFLGEAESPYVTATTVRAIANGVELDRRTLPVIGSGAATVYANVNSSHFRSLRGRPRKWDWDAAMCAIIAKANGPSGLPEGYGAQAEVGRMLAKWFSENQNGEPTPSEIGLRAAQIMTAIDNSRK